MIKDIWIFVRAPVPCAALLSADHIQPGVSARALKSVVSRPVP